MKKYILLFVFAVSCSDPVGPDTTIINATVDQVLKYDQPDGTEHVTSFLRFEDGWRKGYDHYWGEVGTEVECEIIGGQYPDDPERCMN